MSNDVTQGDAVRLAHRIGSEIAAVHAQDVDRNARFPAESIAALKEAKLLSALVPVELGAPSDGMRPVLKGIEEGKPVVTGGAFHLNNERKRAELE